MLHLTEQICSLNISRAKLAFLFLLTTLSTQAQFWEKVDSISFESNVIDVSHDLQQNIYVVLEDDQLIKLDREFKPTHTFAQPNLGPITSIEAQITLNPFLFIRDNQQVSFLDRFLASPVTYDLSQWTDGFVWLATPAIDRQLWLLENYPLRISKADRFTGNILHEIPIQIGYELENITSFRAQQMTVLLVDEQSGIHLFDLFGNLISSIEVKGVRKAQLNGSRLTYFAESKIFIHDLDSGEAQSFEAPGNYTDGIQVGKHFVFLKGNRLLRYGMYP